MSRAPRSSEAGFHGGGPRGARFRFRGNLRSVAAGSDSRARRTEGLASVRSSHDPQGRRGPTAPLVRGRAGTPSKQERLSWQARRGAARPDRWRTISPAHGPAGRASRRAWKRGRSPPGRTGAASGTLCGPLGRSGRSSARAEQDSLNLSTLESARSRSRRRGFWILDSPAHVRVARRLGPPGVSSGRFHARPD